MAKTARSARGEVVDFDVIMIKNELASAPPSIQVAARQDFIENKISPRREPTKAVVIGRDSGHVVTDDNFDNDNDNEPLPEGIPTSAALDD